MFSRASVRFGPGEAAAELARITSALREAVLGDLRRRGVVVGLSGGIDSSVVAALCARALGPEHVLGLFMNEAESAPETRAARARGRRAARDPHRRRAAVAAARGGRLLHPARQRDPHADPGVRRGLALQDRAAERRSRATASASSRSSSGRRTARSAACGCRRRSTCRSSRRRTSSSACARCSSTTTRTGSDYAVAGTPNLLEYDQGFFVKNGDGAADMKPIAHLYKTQVYQLAELLGDPRGDPPPPADHGYLLAAAVAGGVLLLAAVRPDGRLPVRAGPRRARRRGGRGTRARRRSRSSACTATSTPSAPPRATCTHRRGRYRRAIARPDPPGAHATSLRRDRSGTTTPDRSARARPPAARRPRSSPRGSPSGA